MPKASEDAQQGELLGAEGVEEAPGHAKTSKALVGSSRFLAVAGLLLVLAGAALLAAGLTVSAKSGAPAPVPPPQQPTVDSEGVPLDAASDGSQADQEQLDCGVKLHNRSAYVEAAHAAEAALFGGSATSLPPDELQQRLDALPRLLLGTVFWVLVREGIGTNSSSWRGALPEAAAAAAAQVQVVNAALQPAGLQLRLDAVVGVPAPNAVIQGCTHAAVWEQVARQVASSSDALHQRINFVLCEPRGTNGAARILDGPLNASTSAVASTILLRRSALQSSTTTAVHQLGHFFGLAHPFPDGKPSCKYDADAIADTPLQYAANTGCSDTDSAGVCENADPSLAVPTSNYMDLTNDTCRWHFTLGQLARMRAMLQAYRPGLAKAGLQPAYPAAAPLNLTSAFQSGMPADAVLQQQLLAALTGRGAVDSPVADSSSTDLLALGSLSGLMGFAAALGAASHRLGDSWQQAALASDGLLYAGVDKCSCVGPDAYGRLFWTGQLNGTYYVDAVQLLLPVNVSVLADLTPDSFSGSSPADNIDTGSSNSEADTSSNKSEAEPGNPPAAEAAAAPAPANDALPNSGLAALQVEVRIGSSPEHSMNQLCTQAPVQLEGPLLQIECERPVGGRYVTIAALAAGATTASSGRQQQGLCLCEVRPLSYVSPAQQATDTQLAVELPLSSLATASQSSIQGGAAAAAALGGAAAAAGLGPQRNCSSTLPELQPRWWLSSGLDPLWVRGLLLSKPPDMCSSSSTSSSTDQGCSRRQHATRLSVYVTDAEMQPGNWPPTRRLCAGNVTALPGQLTQIVCGRFMQGHVITVVAETGSTAASLSLCGLQVLGAYELPLASAASLQSGTQQVQPAALQPDFTFAMDGDARSCLETGPGSSSRSSSSSRWQLTLQQPYSLAAVGLQGSGSSLGVEVLDSAGVVVWSASAAGAAANASTANSSSGNSSGGAIGPQDAAAGHLLELPAPAAAQGLRVNGFTSLCEVSLLVRSLAPAGWQRLQPPAAGNSSGGNGDNSAATAGPAWLVQGSNSSSNGSTASVASVVIDGNYRTCYTASGSGAVASSSQPFVTLQLGSMHRLAALEVVAASAANMSITAAAPPGQAQASTGVCALGVPLQPWQPATVACDAPVDTDVVEVWLEHASEPAEIWASAAPGQPPAGPDVALCELGLLGLRLPGQA